MPTRGGNIGALLHPLAWKDVLPQRKKHRPSADRPPLDVSPFARPTRATRLRPAMMAKCLDMAAAWVRDATNKNGKRGGGYIHENLELCMKNWGVNKPLMRSVFARLGMREISPSVFHFPYDANKRLAALVAEEKASL